MKIALAIRFTCCPRQCDQDRHATSGPPSQRQEESWIDADFLQQVVYFHSNRREWTTV